MRTDQSSVIDQENCYLSGELLLIRRAVDNMMLGMLVLHAARCFIICVKFEAPPLPVPLKMIKY